MTGAVAHIVPMAETESNFLVPNATFLVELAAFALLFYLSAPGAAAIGRASIIFFFLFTDLLGVGYFAAQGIVTTQSFVQSLAWLPALLVGVWIALHESGIDPLSNGHELVLTTCWPFDALTPGPERYILHATMITPDS